MNRTLLFSILAIFLLSSVVVATCADSYLAEHYRDVTIDSKGNLYCKARIYQSPQEIEAMNDYMATLQSCGG